MDRAQLPIDRLRMFGDPVLKQESREVTEFDAGLLKLAEMMFEVMDREQGIGLAAPQIGIGKKLMVWRDPDSEERSALVNPRIVERSDETSNDTEGCLSLPGHAMEIARAERVVVHAQDLNGGPVTLTADGFRARIMQHEIDHLEGHLILDRTTGSERRRVLKEIRERSLDA
jgi:peptide deformylase